MSYARRVICVLLILYGHFGLPDIGFDMGWLAPAPVELAAYVYESDETGNSVPPYVAAGMREISGLGIPTAIIDVDVVDGDGNPTHPNETEAAKAHGLPAFTVTRGGKATAVDVPKEGQFVEAVK